MKLFAPKYYCDFKCIADKCSHSCCIGWEIDIDSDTFKKYRSSRASYAKSILDSIDKNDTPHFMLDKNERCPHLNSLGLCSIITNLGEEFLCEICREHPRFYNDTPFGKEVGLGMACEEACRIILNSDSYSEMVEIGKAEGDTFYCDFDAISHRQYIYGVLSDKALSLDEKLLTIYNKYDISPIDTSEAVDMICKLEYLDKEHMNLFLNYSHSIATPKTFEKKLERALAYFIYRHCTEVYNYEEFLCALGFCLFCERLLCSVANILGDTELSARIISEELEYSVDNTEAIKLHYI